jgi:hypothetical protein
MQHDTSPHEAKIGGVMTGLQSASVVLCYSRMMFFQHYPRFTRFECKAFLAQAIAYFGARAFPRHAVVAAKVRRVDHFDGLLVRLRQGEEMSRRVDQRSQQLRLDAVANEVEKAHVMRRRPQLGEEISPLDLAGIEAAEVE